MKAIQKVKVHPMRAPALDWMTATLDVQLVLARKEIINRELDQHQLREGHILSNLPIPYHNIPKRRSQEMEREKIKADHAPSYSSSPLSKPCKGKKT